VLSRRPSGELGRLIDDALACGHLISMTLEHIDAGDSFSVATCACGWQHKVKRGGQECHREQDRMVEAHWREATSKPHPEEARSAVSKDEAAPECAA
jgi:hypothetical protein